MTSAEIEAELSVRLYRWAILDAQREVNQDYPFVRSIKNHKTHNYLQYVEQLSYEARLKLAVSLVKRVHSVAVKNLGEVLTEDDNKANLQYQQFSKTTYPEYLSALRSRKCETCVLIDKTKFFKRIVNELEVAFGCQVKKTDPFSCSITVPIGSWFLKTYSRTLVKDRRLASIQSVHFEECFGFH